MRTVLNAKYKIIELLFNLLLEAALE